jgi:hypothetical protein
LADKAKDAVAGIPAQSLAKEAEQTQTQWYARQLTAGQPAAPAVPGIAGVAMNTSPTAASVPAGAAALSSSQDERAKIVMVPLQDAAKFRGQWEMLLDAEDAALSGRLELALTILDGIVRATPDSRIALRAQVRIGEIAQERLKDTARARAAFEACLAPPLQGHLGPDLRREIERRLSELPQAPR